MVLGSQVSRPRNPLLLEELFHSVLQHLITSPEAPTTRRPPPSEDRRTLAALARTCRAFSEPSLNHLWRSLDSLLPLLRCFSDVVDETRAKTPPSDLEWLIINRYSHRIQELTLGIEYLSLHFLQRTGLVLPNLKVFRWKCLAMGGFIWDGTEFPFESIEFLWPLLTPRITALEATLSDPYDAKFASFLEKYPILCPNLKSIKLGFSVDTLVATSDAPVVFQAICSRDDWQCVDISSPVNDDTLKHLGMSPTLKKVSLTFGRSRPDEVCFKPADTPFRDVTDLALVVWNSLSCATSLLRPRDQAFCSFKVTLHTGTTTAEVSALFAALSSPPRVRSLRSVVLQEIPSTQPFRSTEWYRQCFTYYEALRPLAPLMHLRELAVSLDTPFAFIDTEFAILVRNWPLLETLKIIPSRLTEYPTESITLKGLLSLLSSCRKLRKIELTVDAREVPTGVDEDARSSSVSSLILRNSSISNADLVAEFMLNHMPSMRSVDTYIIPRSSADSECSQYGRLWRQVVKDYMARKNQLPPPCKGEGLTGDIQYLDCLPKSLRVAPS